jgi:hypothetical protein
MTEPSERRRKQRAACLLVVRFSAADDAARGLRPASVLDLNETGCRLRVSEPLATGASLLLRFEALLHDGIKSASIETPARVMWCRPLTGSSCELGAEFDAAPAGLSEILRALGRR